MKKTFSSILVAALTVFTFLTISCDVGMGEAVDLEAPEITVSRMVAGDSETTNFGTTIYTKQSVTFYGTCYDNVEINKVYAQVKWVGDDDYRFLANATVSGGEWKLSVSFPKEGACWLKISAEDKKGNYGTKSSKVVTLFVDENAPVGDAWYIDRLVSGIQYSLQTKETLESIVAKDPKLLQPSNIDVAQNGEFKICSSFNDASGIKSIKISIWEGNTKLGDVTQDSESSKYAPQFTISKSKVGALPESGLHYLQVKYSAEDVVTDPSSNSVEDKDFDMGWFIWWPESDNPRYYISQADDRGDLNLHINDSVNVTVFDDDGFKSGDVIKCLLKDDSGNVSGTFSYSAADGERECNIIVKAPSESQSLKMNVTATDKYSKNLNNTCNVLVTDDNHPTLIITSPENNQIPSVLGDDSDISFTGITLDASGCTYLKFIWIPDSVADKKTRAIDWLKDHESITPNSNTADVINGSEGMKLYNVKLSAATDENGLKKQTFAFKISLTGAFGDDKTKDKYFYIRLIRKDGNYTDSELKLAADNIKPELKLLNPTGNMAIIDKDEPLTLKFKAEKSSGLSINPSKYKIEYIKKDGTTEAVGGSYDPSDGYYKSSVISTATLSDIYNSNYNPKYKFYAEDILGNKIDSTYQFIISALPQISSVSSSASTKCKADDEILINVSFTKPVTCTSDAKLKITNISNALKSQASTAILHADYDSGSSSTSLVFKYKVQNGDKSAQLQVVNTPGYGPIENEDTVSGHLTFLTTENNLQAKKTITIDGVKPSVTEIKLSSDVDTTKNVYDGITYLKEGRTLTATVKVNKKVTIQGSPSFTVSIGSKSLVLNWQSVSYPDSSSSIIVFSKKITSDYNGDVLYDKDTCINGIGFVKDDYGNSMINSLTGAGTEKINIDTIKPAKPVIKDNEKNEVLKSGKYKDKVQFMVSNVIQEHTKTEYSVDGGTTWHDYAEWTDTDSWAAEPKELTATSSVFTANLVVRINDRAGNVSDYSDPLSLEINNNFPSYTVECTKGDGNYKSGDLILKVSFAEPVKISSASTAYIELSGNSSNDKFKDSTPTAVIVESQKGQSEVSEVTFKYTIQQGDSFSLKVAKDAVKLIGITDMYGVAQNSKELAVDYVRTKLCCDNVPPEVVKMTPGGTKKAITGKNIYSAGKSIELEFSEPVKVVSGKIYLRQTAGWAIPPVFKLSEFNKVLSAVKAAGNKKIGNFTGTQILYMDGAEDSEWIYSSDVGSANDRYHGTSKFVGPYKKSSQGLDENNIPDYKNTKYVLDYDVEIWGDDDSVKKKFGYTFPTGQDSISAADYPRTVSTGKVKFRDLSSVQSITTNDIRNVLESIHFHERYMNVNSSSVKIDSIEKNKVTITVPNGFLGDDDLQPGREWELVIEKGCFMDESGNYFGYEADGKMKQADSMQATNGETLTDTSSWGRYRSSVSSTDSIKPLVLIQDGANLSFLSSGVAKPVIRVDRYSYGLGMHQPSLNSNGTINNSAYIKVDSTGDRGITKPTALVRVRIDCETEGAKIKYGENHASKSKTDATVQSHSDLSNIGSDDWKKSVSKKSETTVTLPSSQTLGNVLKVEFLSGSGDYTKSYKQLISAKAFYENQESAIEKEGVFQSVLNIDNPMYNNGTDSISSAGNGKHFVSVRGTTGFAGEPSISPFPLRDSAVGSSYLRQTYKDGNQYYWISYEIFLDSSISIYAYGKNWRNERIHDWGCNWGLMSWGEFSNVTMLRSWIGKD